jgi:hypothetical protein
VLDQQQPNGTVGAEEQFTQGSRIECKTNGQHPGFVTAKQCLHMAVKALGAVVRQKKQARDTRASHHLGALIGQIEPALFSGKLFPGALQASHDPACMMDAAYGLGEFKAEMNLRDLDLSPGPQGPAARGQDAQKPVCPGISLDQLRQTNQPARSTHF